MCNVSARSSKATVNPSVEPGLYLKVAGLSNKFSAHPPGLAQTGSIGLVLTKGVPFGLSLVIVLSLALAAPQPAQGRAVEPQKASARRPRKSKKKAKRAPMKQQQTPPAAAAPTRLPLGLWGGEHIRLEVNETGARLEFDCAHGSVASPITLDGRLHFDFEGVYVSERGGPERPGQTPDTHTARYTGRVEGDKMFLSVALKHLNQNLGTYTLTRGAEPLLVKCL